ncbi:hypothetical protein Taro_049283 [Colocasia esculenta]|uniref:Uncharacterized protein n=1 Tax=Colocasia esculenta TaxID=4460 RepID=A0A843XAM6_COLES|nr:hypothetical protein [Colocasia esculenta]
MRLDSSSESFVELSCLGLGCRGVRSAFLAQTRQSFVSLPLSTLVLEPRSGARRGVTAWPGCGVVCLYGGSVSPFAGVEAGARLASRARGLQVPLLAASGGGLVAVVVTTGASGGSRSMFLRFRGSVPWCLSVVAPVGVVPDLVRVQGLGGSACGPSTRWRSEVAVLVVRRRSHLVVVWSRQVCRGLLPLCARLRWFLQESFRAVLAGEGLVIPTGPCSRGIPPYFLQLGAHRHGSTVSDGLRRRLWRCVVVSSSESVRLPCMIRARAAGCSCCCTACVASVVAQRVHAVAAWLVLDSLEVVSLDAEMSRCLACCVASLVERCNTYLWLLSTWCWLVVSSSEAEVHSLVACVLVRFPRTVAVVLVRVALRTNDVVVVLVEVLPGPACVASAVLLAAVFSLMICVLWSWGVVHSGEGSSQDHPLSLLAEVLPRSALCSMALGTFWWRFSPRLLRVVMVVAQALAPVPLEHGHGGLSIMERFKRMDLPSFMGES